MGRFTPLWMTSAIFLAYWNCTKPWGLDLPNRLLATFILTILQITSTEIALGLLKLLTPFHLLSLNGFIFVLLIVFTIFRRAKSGLPPKKTTPTPTISEFILFVISFVIYSYIFFLNTLIPPYDWDSLTYHLVDVLFYAQEKTIRVFPYPGNHYTFPKVGELLTLWIYLLGGGDSVAYRHLNCVQVPFAFLGGVALVSSSMSLGLKKNPWILFPLYALTPIVMIQSLTTMVDLIAGSIFLVVLAFILLFLKTRRRLPLYLTFLSLGILLGIKFTFLYFSLPLVLILLFGRIRVTLLLGRILNPKWKTLSLLFLLLFLGGGFWYLRNLILFWNPIYPTEVTIGGFTLFKGPYWVSPQPGYDRFFVENPLEWFFYPFREKMWNRFVYNYETGFGPQFLLGLICSVWAVFVALKRKKWMTFWTLLAIPILIALWVYPHPYHSPRYLIQLIGLVFLGLKFIMEISGKGLRLWLSFLVWISILFSIGSTIGSLAPHEEKAIQVLRETGKPPTLFQYYGWEYGQLADSWEWLSLNTMDGKKVVFTNDQLIAPLFGWENRNQLIWVSPPEKPPFFNIPRARNYLDWLRLLNSMKAELLYLIDPKWEEHSPSLRVQWVKEHPEDFQLLQSWTAHHYAAIYKILYRSKMIGDEIKPQSPLEDLNHRENWSIAYKEGAHLSLHYGTNQSGLVLEWNFNTQGNDYAEAVSYPMETDWEHFKFLTFWIFLETPKDLLFVYLKNSNPREFVSFRIDMEGLKPGWNQIELPLRSPNRKSKKFSFKEVNSIHLVIDDHPDSRIGKGKMEIRDFRGIVNG